MQEAENSLKAYRLRTRKAVQVILENHARFDEKAAAEWAEQIDTLAETSCQMIRATERLCAQICREQLRSNPSRDLSGADDMLRKALHSLDQHLEEQGHPMEKTQCMPEEEAFWAQLDAARGDLKAGRRPQMTDEQLEALIAEVTTRNALYDSMKTGEVEMPDPGEVFVMDRGMYRACAVTMAVWLGLVCGKDCGESEEENSEENQKENPEETEAPNPDWMMLHAGALHRLGYLDHQDADMLHAQAEEVLDQEAQQMHDAPQESVQADRRRLLPLCAAGLLGGLALAHLAPVNLAAGLAAVIMGYLLIR